MKNKRIKIVLVTCLAIISIFLCSYFKDSKVTKSNFDNVKVSTVEEVYNSPIGDLRKNYNNPDIIAELKISSIGLDTVITKSDDNKFYLDHDVYKNKSMFGNPYVDYRNDDDLDMERQVNIYSHNFYDSKYDDYLPFSKLENYLEEETFNNSSEIYLLTKDKIIKYELYALKIITTDNEHTILDSSSDEKWQGHLDRLLSGAKYCKDDCHLSKNEKLLIMQTCNYSPKNSFLLVIARKI